MCFVLAFGTLNHAVHAWLCAISSYSLLMTSHRNILLGYQLAPVFLVRTEYRLLRRLTTIMSTILSECLAVPTPQQTSNGVSILFIYSPEGQVL
ncbi:uncharacterized protein EURHEDRAFT_417951 [Aspergillus ruber CBS 135680]|uniref:Secreted protein n=1 Tax=Aspergillus ruber (strain CBS 135680) TaxID=1388766 RepID=A0A017RZD7_ASPRC|nr:uncharacterized protein EURHEDRAFT_417951 [Aspergillus ruber CBS 135680]EYE89946.1 hypothetical protein EURHEDRAFT_417951 [Aspergillus ruber CBS 135680]